MIARIDYASSVGETGFLQNTQKSSDIRVHERHESEVGGDGATHACLIKGVIVCIYLTHGLYKGMPGALSSCKERRPWNLGLGIEIVPFGSCNQRDMSANQLHEEDPWSVHLLLHALAQPTFGRCGDPIVIGLLRIITAAGFQAELQRFLSGGRVVPDQCKRIADPGGDVQGHDLFAEAVVVVAGTKMQFADRCDVVSF